MFNIFLSGVRRGFSFLNLLRFANSTPFSAFEARCALLCQRETSNYTADLPQRDMVSHFYAVHAFPAPKFEHSDVLNADEIFWILESRTPLIAEHLRMRCRARPELARTLEYSTTRSVKKN